MLYCSHLFFIQAFSIPETLLLYCLLGRLSFRNETWLEKAIPLLWNVIESFSPKRQQRLEKVVFLKKVHWKTGRTPRLKTLECRHFFKIFKYIKLFVYTVCFFIFFHNTVICSNYGTKHWYNSKSNSSGAY